MTSVGGCHLFGTVKRFEVVGSLDEETSRVPDSARATFDCATPVRAATPCRVSPAA